MASPCLRPQVGAATGGELESAWPLTIDGDGQGHRTTLDWMGTASYYRREERADPSVSQVGGLRHLSPTVAGFTCTEQPPL